MGRSSLGLLARFQSLATDDGWSDRLCLFNAFPGGLIGQYRELLGNPHLKVGLLLPTPALTPTTAAERLQGQPLTTGLT